MQFEINIFFFSNSSLQSLFYIPMWKKSSGSREEIHQIHFDLLFGNDEIVLFFSSLILLWIPCVPNWILGTSLSTLMPHYSTITCSPETNIMHVKCPFKLALLWFFLPYFRCHYEGSVNDYWSLKGILQV